MIGGGGPLAALAVILRLALRDLRAARRSLAILVAGIALGVAAIAGGGSVAGTALEGTRGQARLAVGGDLSLRLFHRPFTAAEQEALRTAGRLSLTAELRPRAVVPGGDRGTLVELKAVDAVYPLVGAVDLAPPQPLAAALTRGPDGRWGAVADASLFDALALQPGDTLRLGALTVTLRARLEAEPDRTFRALELGPRVMIAAEALAESGLATPGAPVYHYARLLLPEGADARAAAQGLEDRFPDAGWRLVEAADGVPGLERVLAIAEALLVLIGLAVLLVGALGAAGAVRAHLTARAQRLAVLRALGASPAAAAAVGLAQVGLAAGVAVALGLGLGAAAALACRPLLAGLGLAGAAGVVQPQALAAAAGFGLLAAGLAALGPLDTLARTPAPRLLTGAPAAPPRRRRRMALLTAAGAGVAGIAAAVLTDLPVVTVVFLALVTLAGLAAAGGAVLLRRAAARVRAPGRPVLRLALGALARPGGPTAPVMTTLGLTLTVLVCIAALDANARRHLAATLPASAPETVLLGVPPEAAPALVADLAALPGLDRVRAVPFLHGTLAAVNGVAVRERPVPRDMAWVARGDRGLSWAAEPPPDTAIVAGTWWDAAPSTETRLSVDARVAERLGVGVGDTLTLAILGRPVTGTIANLRRVDWARLDLDFPILLSPPPEPPPHTVVVALWGTPQGVAAARDRAAARLPTVAALDLAPVLDRLTVFVTGAATALTAASGLTLAAALVVLAGATAADQRRRVREAAVLTMIGATPRQVLAAGLLAHGLLGLATAAAAVPLGLAAAWAVLAGALPGTWQTPLAAPLGLAAAAVALLAAVGWGVTAAALRHSPAAVLRQVG
ncbi:ABC transporter permease [Caenispirillum bisanense]|uniref:Putative ABC transport system permease protein n=1 Tax=Caenispirillum bisanense TaxID=414052 RepID=A0A286GIQ6_9PROT|nr:FtsX-like permease family protein [Caenispirillum bisanense]SOD95423.1 putative ABC transport system permease protein [Caenispirillum bisanense]